MKGKAALEEGGTHRYRPGIPLYGQHCTSETKNKKEPKEIEVPLPGEADYIPAL